MSSFGPLTYHPVDGFPSLFQVTLKGFYFIREKVPFWLLLHVSKFVSDLFMCSK